LRPRNKRSSSYLRCCLLAQVADQNTQYTQVSQHFYKKKQKKIQYRAKTEEEENV
jgi:hypothetical protein